MINWEVIVIDNGSEEKIQLRKDYKFKLALLEESAPGSYSARNKGLEVANGEVLVFTDANCIPDPDWLEKGIARLTSEINKVDLVGGNVELFDPTDRGGWAAFYDIYTGFGQEKNFEERGFAATANLFAHRHVFLSIGAFDSSLMSGGDFEWCWRAQTSGFKLGYEHQARMRHPCRTSLASLIRQARRVESGRRQLGAYFYSTKYTVSNNLSKPRSLKGSSRLSAALSILQGAELSFNERFKLLSIGLVLRSVTIIERLRLMLGKRAERE